MRCVGVDDTPDDVRTKRLLHGVGALQLFVSLAGIGLGMESYVSLVAVVVSVVSAVALFLYLYVLQGVVAWMPHVFVGISFVCIAVLDYAAAASEAGPFWPLYFCLQYVVRSMQVGSWASMVVLLACMGATLLSGIEGAAPFGISDFPDREGRAVKEVCFAIFIAWGCLVCHYVVCGWLQSKTETEPNYVPCISNITRSLAAFDLIETKRLLQSTDLPPDLFQALEELHATIVEVRPYLPSSVLPTESPVCAPPEQPEPPAGGDGAPFSETSFMDNSFLRLAGSGASSVLQTGATLQTRKSSASHGQQTKGRQSFMSARTAHSEEGNHVGLSVDMGVPLQPLQAAKVTLVVVHANRVMGFSGEAGDGSMRSLLENNTGIFSANHSLVVAACVLRFTQAKGVVDNIVGEHFYGSFNASKKCTEHANAACSSAKRVISSVPQISLNAAVMTGKAWSGNLGSNAMRRFNILGKLPTLASAYERVGKMWSKAIVCNKVCAIDAFSQCTRRVPARLRIYQGDIRDTTGSEHAVYELVPRIVGDDDNSESEQPSTIAGAMTPSLSFFDVGAADNRLCLPGIACVTTTIASPIYEELNADQPIIGDPAEFILKWKPATEAAELYLDGKDLEGVKKSMGPRYDVCDQAVLDYLAGFLLEAVEETDYFIYD